MTFRPRLAPLVLQAVMTTIVIYFVLKLAGRGFAPVVEAYTFGFAAVAGLVHLVFLVLTKHAREGLRVDTDGLRDQGAGVAVAWDAVKAVRLGLEKRVVRGKEAVVRVATIAGPDTTLRFGDLGGSLPARLDGILNIEGAAIVLAAVAARTGSSALFPSSWNAPPPETPSPEVEIGPEASARPNNEEKGGLIATLFKLGAKAGAVALKLLKAIKPGAVLVTLAAYSLVFSWQFAVGLMVMIGVHECGHVFAMWRTGVKVKGIYFVPFFGGVAVAKGVAGTRAGSAYIALNGPVWGTLLAIACLLAWLGTGMHHPFLAGAAGWGALLNLFNLMPIFPLDGGRVVGTLAHATGRGLVLVFAFLVFGAALAYLTHLELLWLVGIIGLFELGTHLAAAPYPSALGCIGTRPFGGEEAEHFDRMVARVVAGRTSAAQEKARIERYGQRLDAARQTPLTTLQRLAILAAYAGLVAVLLGIAAIAARVPGAGVHLSILR